MSDWVTDAHIYIFSSYAQLTTCVFSEITTEWQIYQTAIMQKVSTRKVWPRADDLRVWHFNNSSRGLPALPLSTSHLLRPAPLAHDDKRYLHIDRLQQQLLCFVVYTFSFTAFGHKYELKYNVAICYTTLCLLFVYCLFVGVFFLQGTLLSRASIPRHHDLGMARLCQQYSLALVRWHNRQDSTL